MCLCPDVRAVSTRQSHSLTGLQSSSRPAHAGASTAALLGLGGVSWAGRWPRGLALPRSGCRKCCAPLRVAAVQPSCLGLVRPRVPEPGAHQVCSDLHYTGAEIKPATQPASSAPATPVMLPRLQKKRGRDRVVISGQTPPKFFTFAPHFFFSFLYFPLI